MVIKIFLKYLGIRKYFSVELGIINIISAFIIDLNLYKGVKYNILKFIIFSEPVIILSYIISNIINIFDNPTTRSKEFTLATRV